MGRLRDRSTTVFRNVVLPVPALPVRNMLRPVFSTNSHAVRSSWFRSVFILLLFRSDYKRKDTAFFQRMQILQAVFFTLFLRPLGIHFVNHSKKLPFGNLPLGNFL